MPTYAYPTRTQTLDTPTVATLYDALIGHDIPQAYRNALLCQLVLKNANEPGLPEQGQNLKLPNVSVSSETMGGTRAEVFVNFEVGVTAQSFNGLDILNTSIAEGPTVSWTDYGQYTCFVAIAGTEKAKNSGKMKRLDLLMTRQNMEIRQLTRTMETDLWSTKTDTTDGSQNAFAGMRHKIALDPTTGTLQGLNRATYTTWRNQYTTSVGSFATGGLDAMRSMFFSTAGTNAMEPCHLIATTSTVAGYIVKALEGIHRVVGSLDNQDLSASRLPTFMGIPIVHTDDCPSGYQYWWNFDYMRNIIHEGGNWSSQIPGRPNDQWVEDQQRWIYMAAPLMQTRPEKQGVMAGITA